MNDSYWERQTNERSVLYTVDKIPVAELKKYTGLHEQLYHLMIKIPGMDLLSEYDIWDCKTIEEAEWRANNTVHMQCNRWANALHKIRDHLPTAKSMYEKAVSAGLD